MFPPSDPAAGADIDDAVEFEAPSAPPADAEDGGAEERDEGGVPRPRPAKMREGRRLPLSPCCFLWIASEEAPPPRQRARGGRRWLAAHRARA